MEISIDTIEGITVVELAGDLDTNTSRDVQSQLLGLTVPKGKMILQLNGVSYMSSAGLRMLLSLYRHTSNHDGQLVLVGVADEIRDTMEVTGFLDFFTACTSMQDAMHALDDPARG